MTEQTKRIWQMVIVFVLVFGLLIWWAAYRLGYIPNVSAPKRDQVLKNMQRNNDAFLRMLENNAKMLASSTKPTTVTSTVPAAGLPAATSTQQ